MVGYHLQKQTNRANQMHERCVLVQANRDWISKKNANEVSNIKGLPK
jgi:hypothetical protein